MPIASLGCITNNSMQTRATRPNCGKPLKPQDTKLVWKHTSGRQEMSGKVIILEDTWAIRSQAPKSVMIGYGEGSETKW